MKQRFYNIFSFLKEGENLKFIIFLILSLTEIFWYAIPLYMWMIVPNLPERLGLSQAQYLNILAAYGFATVLFFLLNDWIIENFRLKSQISLALFILPFLILVWIFLPFWGGDVNELGENENFWYLVSFFILYIFWGAIDSLLFWPQLEKAFSLFSKNKKNTGNIIMLRSFINGLVGFFIVYLLGLTLLLITISVSGVNLGFLIYGLFFVITTFSIACLFFYYFKNEKSNKVKKKKQLKNWKILKNLEFWLISFLIMGTLTIRKGTMVLSPYLEYNLFISAWILSIIGVISVYLIRIISGMEINKIKRKHAELNIAIVSLIVSIFLVLFIASLPGFGEFSEKTSFYQLIVKILVTISFILLVFIVTMLAINRYALIKESSVYQKNENASIAYFNFIASSSSAWLYLLLGIISSNHILDDGSGVSTQWGNQLSLFVIALIAFICLLCGIWLWFLQKKRIKTF